MYEMDLVGQGQGLPSANILRLDGERVGGSGQRTVHFNGKAY